MAIKPFHHWKQGFFLLVILLPIRFIACGTANSVEPETGMDKIVFFNPTHPVYSVNLTWAKNVVYQLTYESYTPAAAFNITCMITAPSGLQYLVWNRTHPSSLDYLRYGFEYGAAETGLHFFTITVHTPANLSLYLHVTEVMPLGRYYETFVLNDLTVISNESLRYYYNDTFAVNSAQKSRFFTLDFENDTEYWVDCIRTNPVTAFQVNGSGYILPAITMTITLQDVAFPIWVQQALDPRQFRTNDKIHLRLGFPWSGIARIEFGINESVLPTNLAFICYSLSRVGDGPDVKNDTDANNTTNSNTTRDVSSFLNTNMSWFEELTVRFELWTTQYFDSILIMGGCGIALLSAINYYHTNKKTRIQPAKDLREVTE